MNHQHELDHEFMKGFRFGFLIGAAAMFGLWLTLPY